MRTYARSTEVFPDSSDPGYGFSLLGAKQNLPLYLLASVIFVPGGLIATFFYRGPHRWEIISAVVLPLTFFTFYEYSGRESGWLKGLILGPRLLIPIVPILTFSVANVTMNWLSKLNKRAKTASAAFLVITATISSSAVHPIMDEWSGGPRAIRDALYKHTPERSVIVSNLVATKKFLNNIYGERAIADIYEVEWDDYSTLFRNSNTLYLALLDRSDSAFWKKQSLRNEAIIEIVNGMIPIELQFDQEIAPSQRLRIWLIKD